MENHNKLDNQYKHRLGKIEAVLNTFLPESFEPSWVEQIFELPSQTVSPVLAISLTRPGRDLLDRGGKRWRPLLMYLIAEALAGEEGAAAALPLTPLVEIAHNASLIHDDIEDSSDERRGKPAIHLIYGNDAAINSGAFLYFLPLACLSGSGFKAETKNRIAETWGLYMRRLHLGQAMDISWHNDHKSLPQIHEYEIMCGLKTGCLARMAAVLAVHCVEDCLAACGKKLPGDLAEKMGDAAEKLGVGFQILDDVKNLKTGVPGKKRGDDIVEGKKSLPVLLYLHKYPQKKEFAGSCFTAARSKGISAPELLEFINALETAGVIEEAQKKGAELINESRALLSGSGVYMEAEAGALLDGLIDFISS